MIIDQIKLIGLLAKYPHAFRISKLSNISMDDFNLFKNDSKILPMDGIVYTEYPITTLEYTKKYPKYSVALKPKPQIGETYVNRIIYDISKLGRLTIRLEIKEVTLGNKLIKYINGNNQKWLAKNSINIGSKIVIKLAGEVTPVYSTTLIFKKYTPIVKCPKCHSTLTSLGLHDFCDNCKHI